VPVLRFKQNVNVFYRRFSAGDYSVLYNTLSTYDWSSLYNEISVDAAVDRLNVAVTQATDLPSGYITKHKSAAWFSGKLKFALKRKIIL
jgi:hypothetical protein